MARLPLPNTEGDETIRVWGINPDMGYTAATFSAKVYEKSKLPDNEREMARIRIAQINDCHL
jgi:alkylhydroperoxidase family enzyme